MPDDLGPLRDAVAALPAHAGVVVLAGDGTELFAEHADEAFPSASVITSATARSLLGLVGWLAYRSAGGAADGLPSEWPATA
jgi:hypothetical protein